MEKLLSLLPILACPLMMLICMKGMFGGKKDCHTNNSQNEIAKKLESLENQNAQLIKEVYELRNQKASNM